MVPSRDPANEQPPRGFAGSADALLAEFHQLALASDRTLELLEAADRVQAKLASLLAEGYPRRAFARLLALRIVNLAVARHHFHHRHSRLASRPFQLMVDPVNNCHLACPGCLHTRNPAFDDVFDWPGGRLPLDSWRHFLESHGAFAAGAVFYNWGEPLLNKQTPVLLREAKRYLLTTMVSSNFSVPFDVDALVSSGLNFLFLSIDGATQTTYEHFRRGGDLALVLENVRKLTEAKRRLGSPVPFVLWRYLTFEHNLHEVDLAHELARELGVDQFSVTTPFSVEWDDPGIRVARSPREGAYPLRTDASLRGPLDDWRSVDLAEAVIDEQFERSWTTRLPLGPDGRPEPSRASAPTCRWLYQNLTLDAGARLLPCCMAPERDRHKVYGTFAAEGAESFNADDFRRSRLAFADRPAFESDPASRSESAPPYCAVCWEKPDLTYTLDRDARRDLRCGDALELVSDPVLETLTSWPASR